jgi:hypothetical protein
VGLIWALVDHWLELLRWGNGKRIDSGGFEIRLLELNWLIQMTMTLHGSGVGADFVL